MKKTESLSIYQVALFGYSVLVVAVIMVLGIISLLKMGLWLVGVIVCSPLAIWGGLSVKRYLYEGGLEEEFKSKSIKEWD